jgi:hypothetical protein
MQATNTIVKMNRQAPAVSQVKMDWEEKQDRSRKAGKVNRRKLRDNKRNRWGVHSKECYLS